MTEEPDCPTSSFHDERLDMAYWYPKIPDSIPTPETYSVEWIREDGEPPQWDTGEVTDYLLDLNGEAFVRGGYKSAQIHGDGSHIRNPTDEEINRTLKELVSQHGMMQMPVGERLWLREHLDLNWCNYTRSTLHPEVRAFVRDGEVVCHHPRLDGFNGYENHREFAEDIIKGAWDSCLREHAETVADAFDGWWSVDFVCTTDGDWYCTDMALDAAYERDGEWRGISAHPEDCEYSIENQYLDVGLEDDNGGSEEMEELEALAEEAEELVSEMEES